jgi:hypothetical protein
MPMRFGFDVSNSRINPQRRNGLWYYLQLRREHPFDIFIRRKPPEIKKLAGSFSLHTSHLQNIPGNAQSILPRMKLWAGSKEEKKAHIQIPNVGDHGTTSESAAAIRSGKWSFGSRAATPG